LTRVLSGAVAIPLVLGITLYGSGGVFFALIAGVVLVGIYEYFSMLDKMGIEGFEIVSGCLGVLLLFCFYSGGQYLPEWGVVSLIALSSAWMLKEQNIKTALDQISYSFLGIFYVAGLSGYFLLIHRLPDGGHWVVFLFLIVWLGDSAAYYGGRKFGRRLIAPTISPGKTIEGALFGLLGSLVGGLIANFWFFKEVSLLHCLLAALICGTIGQIGDFAESILKRTAGVKDSSGLFPGHGGFLDRIDSLLFAGPALYLYHRLFL
jgi:phosphatidate cytidylyltransferase